MKRPYLINNKYLPPRLPIWPTLVTWLLMDRLQAGPLAWGIVGTIGAIVWIVTVVTVVLYVPVHPVAVPRGED